MSYLETVLKLILIAYYAPELEAVLMAYINNKEIIYFIDNTITTSTNLFGDFVIVGSEITEISFNFIVFISL